ncbi:hypothetical protein [Lishizhenia tianjinensis]|nr:hypothetical protein [Lishizhenia tianjinensis]
MVQKIRVEMGKINSIDAINSYTEFMFLEMNRKVFMNLPLSIRMTFWKSPTRTRDKVRLVVPVFLHEAILNTKVQLLEKNNYPYKKLLFVNHEIVFNKKATQLSEEIINLKWRSHLRNNVMKLLKGIYHYTTGLHLQGVLDEYSFKYNYRNTKWCKLRMFMNLEIKCIRQNNGDSG